MVRLPKKGRVLAASLAVTLIVWALFSVLAPIAMAEPLRVTASVVAGEGQVSPASQDVERGQNAEIAITPADAYHIDGITDNGVNVPGPYTSPYVISDIQAAHDVTVAFSATYNVSASVLGGNGTVSPATNEIIPGGTATITMTPAAGYHVDSITDNGVSVPGPYAGTYQISGIDADHAVVVIFSDTYNVAASVPDGHGTALPASQEVLPGAAAAEIVITADVGYHVASITDNGIAKPLAASYVVENVNEDHAVVVAFAIDTFTITATTGAHGAISPAGEVVVGYGSDMTFTITPEAGYHVAELLVDGVAVEPPVETYTFSGVTADHTIAASFAINTYNVNASVSGAGGEVTPTSSSVNWGDTVSITMTPDAGYHIDSITDNGVAVPGPFASPYVISPVTADHVVVVAFSATYEVRAAVTAGSGTALPLTQEVVPGADAEAIVITPEAGYHIASVSDNGVSQAPASPYTVTGVNEDHLVEVAFAIDTFTITATAGPNGSISPAGSVSVDYGTDKTFTITPALGHHITDVLVDGAFVGAVSSYTFVNVLAGHTIAASFAIDTFTVTASVAGGGGSVSPLSQTVNWGSDPVVSITPSAGFHIDSITDNGVPVAGPYTGSYVITDIAADHAIVVTFAETYTVEASVAGGNGAVAPATQDAGPGDDVSVDITADAGYHIASITDNGVAQAIADPYLIEDIAADHVVVVTFAIDTFTVTASVAGTGGTVDPASQTRDYGTDATVAITPDAGFHIVSITDNGLAQPIAAPYLITAIAADHDVVVTFSDTYTVDAVVTAGSGAATPATQEILPGEAAGVAFAPAAGYHIDSITDNGVLVAGPYVSPYEIAAVTADHLVEVAFAIDTFTITPLAVGAGTIAPAAPVTADYGSTQLFTMTPDAGYHVADVQVDGATVGPVAEYEFVNVTEDHSITATFAIDVFTVTAAAVGNGTVAPLTMDYDYGATASVTFTADANHHVASITDNGAPVAGPYVSPYEIAAVNEDHDVVVTFAIDTNTITATAGTGGAIDPEGAISVDHDASQTFTITPDEGYHTADVLVDSGSVGAVASHTFTNVTAAHTIEASFAIDTFTVTASVSGSGGSVTPLQQVVTWGSPASIYATADAGYHVDGISVGGVPVSGPFADPYVIDDVRSDLAVIVTFSDTYNVTAAVDGANGTISPASQEVAPGADGTITITPAAGYHIALLTDNGRTVTPVSPYVIPAVDEDHAVLVSFAIDTFTITATAGAGGAISPAAAQTLDYGSDQAYTIIPDAGYHITDVLVDGASVGAVANYEFTGLAADHTIAASFAIDTFTVGAAVSGSGGTVSPATQVVDWDRGATITITPASGYHIESISDNGTAVAGPYAGSYEVDGCRADHDIVVTFAENEVPVVNPAFYFAEGTCRPGFDTYLTVMNPTAGVANVKVTYMRGDGTTKEQTLQVAAHSRSTISCKGMVAEANGTSADFSAKVESTNGVQIIAERPMYFDYNGWTGGSCVIGLR
ncbi:MAG: beta strand repeat-containing protein [Candidatus Geothermincolia bacterium]